MRNLVYILLAVVASSLLLTNCGGDRAAERQLREADAVMNSDPDSALSILTSMETGGLSEEQRVRHGLMITKASDKSYKSLDNATLISAAVEYYAGRGDSLEVQSLFYQGYYYSEKRINDKALVTLHEAYEKAVAAGDEFYAGMSAREMSTVYRRLLMVKEALKWARMAKSHFLAAGKTMHTAWINNTIANNMIFTNDFRGAEELLDSIERGPYFDNVYMRTNSMVNRIELALERHNYEDVLILYDSLVHYNYDFRSTDRLNQANASIMTGDDVAGEHYLSLARQMPMKESDSLYAAKLQADLFALRKDYRNAYEASRIFSDSILKSDARRLLNPEMLLLTETLRLSEENSRLNATRKQVVILVLSLICVLLCSALGVMVLLHKIKVKNRMLQIDRLLSDFQILKNDLKIKESQISRIRHENTELRRTNADREGELIKEVDNLLSGYSLVVDEICDIWYYNRGDDCDSRESIDRKTKKVYNRFMTLLDKLRSPAVLDGLGNIVDKYYDNWYSRFRTGFPGLKESEYHLVLYLYLRYDSHSIIILCDFKNVQSFYKSKHNLKVKLRTANPGLYATVSGDLFGVPSEKK